MVFFCAVFAALQSFAVIVIQRDYYRCYSVVVSKEETIMKFVDIDIAKVDVDRVNRKGFPEVIYGSGKTAGQIAQIMQVLLDKDEPVLATRVDEAKYSVLKQQFTGLHYNAQAQLLTAGLANPTLPLGTVYVVCAGTSDLAIARETIGVAKWMGMHVEHLYDVGVAGLHRLLSYEAELNEADVIIAIAGMEGALPTVLAGLVDAPVIAVPTSVGYGANLQGITTLLSMLTSCSSGLSVVNIDNGFGAAYQAGLMLRRLNQVADHD